MKIINLTPHSVEFVQGDGTFVSYPSSGVARCKVKQELIDNIGGIPVYKVEYLDVDGLSDPVEGVVYIVSKIVAEAIKDKRNDCYIINESIKDNDGKVIGCKSLSKL